LDTNPALAPTVTAHERLAQEILADLDAVSAKLERLEQLPVESDDFVRAHVNVPVVFMVSTVALVEQRADLRELNMLDPDEGRGTLQYLGAFGTIHDRIIALAGRLKRNMKFRKARLAWKCLQVLFVARGLARDGRDPDLAARVEMLSRDLGPRGRPRKARNR
jgi:hypothetical protein